MTLSKHIIVRFISILFCFLTISCGAITSTSDTKPTRSPAVTILKNDPTAQVSIKSTQWTPTSTEDFDEHKNLHAGHQFSLPSDWTVTNQPSYTVFSPDPSVTEIEDVIGNVGGVVISSSNERLAQVTGAPDAQFESIYQSFLDSMLTFPEQIYEEPSSITVNGLEGMTARFQTQEADGTPSFTIVIGATDGTQAFVAFGSSRASRETNYLPLLDIILNTIRLR